MSVEIAVKSEHLRAIKAEIEKLESDKSKILDWVRGKEREADELNQKADKIREGLIEDSKKVEAKKKDLEKIIVTIAGRENNVSQAEKTLATKTAGLEERERLLSIQNKALIEKEEALRTREIEIDKREAFIKNIFDGIEALK